MARQAATLPCDAPLVRNQVRRAPQASAASRRATSYGGAAAPTPASMPSIRVGTSSASAAAAQRRAQPAVRREAALVAGHHRAARMARGEGDQRLEIRRQALAGVLCGLVHRMVERRDHAVIRPGRRRARGVDCAKVRLGESASA